MDMNRFAEQANIYHFKIAVTGMSSHGSAPHLGRDAVVAAASIVMNLQTYAGRVNNPLEPLALTIGKVRSGRRFNIIAGEAELCGTVWTSLDKPERLKTELEKIVRNTAEALGCTARLDFPAEKEGM